MNGYLKLTYLHVHVLGLLFTSFNVSGTIHFTMLNQIATSISCKLKTDNIFVKGINTKMVN